MKRKTYMEFQPELTPETAYEALDVLSGKLVEIAQTLNGAYAILLCRDSGDLPDDWREHAMLGGIQRSLKHTLDEVRHLSELADIDWQHLPPGKGKWAEIEAEKKKRAQP